MAIPLEEWRKRQQSQAPSPSPAVPGAKFLSPADWGDAPPPAYNWMVEGCFLPGTVGMISGDGGLGKSLLMQQLCTASAIGSPWLGLMTKRVRSLALFCEDDEAELRRRQYWINKWYGCHAEDLAEYVRYLPRPGQDNALVRFGRWGSADAKLTPLFHHVRQEALDFGAQQIILDTRKDVFSGNQIDEDQARAFVNILRRLAIEIEGTAILTAHPSQTGKSDGSGQSGSVAWSNSVRCRLYLTQGPKSEGADSRELRTMKNNSARGGGAIKLEWRQGVFCVKEPKTRNFAEPTYGDDWPAI